MLFSYYYEKLLNYNLNKNLNLILFKVNTKIIIFVMLIFINKIIINKQMKLYL